MTNRPLKILISAGESSGDLYASELIRALRKKIPDAEFFGSPGPRMAQAGVRAIMDQSKLSVVGLVEVVKHIPSIYGEFRKLIRAAERERPDVAILTDSSGFHLRVAKALHRLGIPIVYLVAPQAWAWRRRRVYDLKRNVARLLCIFPFEEKFFQSYGVPATYIGHPLARLIGPSCSREEFFSEQKLDRNKPLVALLPGSRRGEIGRHLPLLKSAMEQMARTQPDVQYLLGTPQGFDAEFIRNGLAGCPVRIVEGQTWDLLAHCDLALAASGTVTVEGALLEAPMVTFYRVTELTWLIGRPLVKVPFYSMVNLIAEEKIVPELIQSDATGVNLANEACRLLEDHTARAQMRQRLQKTREILATDSDPLETAAEYVLETINSRIQ